MHVLVNGVRLFFDVEGAKLVPDGPVMRERPTVLLLHGGPGFDHAIYKPAYSVLADVAQVIYLDHRGNGRSDAGPKEAWTLPQWGDDVRAFCDNLGIDRPIVLGVSFGGMVALSYATRHPAHPAKLIVISTEAAGGSHRERRVALFERLGPEVGALARRRFLEVGGQPDQAALDAWRRLAMPHYTRIPRGADAIARTVSRPEVLHWFHAARRREPQLQYVSRPCAHPMPDPRDRRRGRSDAADRMPGGYRGGAAGPSGSLRAVCGLPARGRAGRPGAGHRVDPGFYCGLIPLGRARA